MWVRCVVLQCHSIWHLAHDEMVPHCHNLHMPAHSRPPPELRDTRLDEFIEGAQFSIRQVRKAAVLARLNRGVKRRLQNL